MSLPARDTPPEGVPCTVSYSPGSWWPAPDFSKPVIGVFPLCPQDMVQSSLSVVQSSVLPTYGYPLRPATFIGINDTVQISIRFINPTDTVYSLVNQSVEAWWVPSVFHVDSNFKESEPEQSKTELGYRIRRWQQGDSLISRPKDLPSQSDDIEMIIDVWNMRSGFWHIAAMATDSIPREFCGQSALGLYEYLQPKDQRDSVNAWEAVFWRAIDDENLQGALTWAKDSVLSVHSTSVPGWRLLGYAYQAQGDSLAALSAYRKALALLQDGLDPWIPDSNLSTATETEVEWIRYMENGLESDIWWLENNPKVIYR